MFCPRCGQQQVSDEVRFCSRCGFQLESVTALLTTGGLPVPVPTPGETPRRKGVRQGGKLILFSFFLMMVILVLHELLGFPDDFAMLGMIVFFGGLLRLVYAVIFEEGPWRKKAGALPQYAPPATFSQPGRSAAELPPSHSVPATGYVPAGFNTAEIHQPPSVTETATRLLDEEKRHSR